MPNSNVDLASSQGLTDALQAAARYVFTIWAVMTGLFAVIGKHDAVALATFIQANVGVAVAAGFGLAGLLTAAWGVYKTWKRGIQAALPMSNPDPKVAS
jgi:hypothetical protein